MKLSLTSDIDKDLVNKKPTDVNLKNVACRYCDGPHWTAMCPFKATFQEDALAKKLETMSTGDGSAAPKDTGKYVPPSQRTKQAIDEATGKTVEKEQSNTIRIANLSDICTEQDLRALCSHFGPVSRVYLAKDIDTGRSRGFAFITFQSMMDAERAANKLNGHLYGNMVLNSSMAENRDRK